MMLPTKYNGESDTGQQITMLSYSGFSWDLTSKAKSDLSANLLNPDLTMEITTQFSFVRSLPSENTLTTDEYTYELTLEERNNISLALDNNDDVSIVIPHLYPRFFRLLEEELVSLDSDEDNYMSINLLYHGSGAEPYWEILPETILLPDKKQESGAIIYTTSDKILSGMVSDILSMIGGVGIVAIYTFILVVLGGNLRALYSTYPWEILYNEMEEPKPLLDMCEGIYLSRSAHYEYFLYI